MLSRSTSPSHTHLGLALCFLGRSEEALVELDTAERLSPRDFHAGLNNIGRAIACFIDERFRGIDLAPFRQAGYRHAERLQDQENIEPQDQCGPNYRCNVGQPAIGELTHDV
jgi:hypothetical protein